MISMKERYQNKVVVFLVLTRNVNGYEEILLQERQNTGYMDGKYDMACSGHLEGGESMSMALVREAKEEINIQIEERDLELVSILHPYQEGYINAFFKAKKYKGIPEIMEKEKCSNLKWFNMEKLPENIIERVKNVIENIKSGIIYDDGDFTHQKYHCEKDTKER